MSAPSGGCVVWFTGLPASGKTTLARRVRDRLLVERVPVALLDGDEVRAALVPSPAYDDAGRDDFYATLARLAALLARQDVVVLVAATAQRRAFRERARAAVSAFVEVYVATPVEECRRRDPKGLYAAASTDPSFTLPGARSEYAPPESPEVFATGGEDAAAAEAIVARVRSLTAPGPAAG